MNNRKIFLTSSLSGIIVGYCIYLLSWIYTEGDSSTSMLIGFSAGFLLFLQSEISMLITHIANDINVMKNIMTQLDTSAITPMGNVLSKAAAEKKQQNYNETILKNGGWKCENCGKANPAYTGTCSCGNSKY